MSQMETEKQQISWLNKRCFKYNSKFKYVPLILTTLMSITFLVLFIVFYDKYQKASSSDDNLYYKIGDNYYKLIIDPLLQRQIPTKSQQKLYTNTISLIVPPDVIINNYINNYVSVEISGQFYQINLVDVSLEKDEEDCEIYTITPDTNDKQCIYPAVCEDVTLKGLYKNNDGKYINIQMPEYTKVLESTNDVTYVDIGFNTQDDNKLLISCGKNSSTSPTDPVYCNQLPGIIIQQQEFTNIQRPIVIGSNIFNAGSATNPAMIYIQGNTFQPNEETNIIYSMDTVGNTKYSYYLNLQPSVISCNKMSIGGFACENS